MSQLASRAALLMALALAGVVGVHSAGTANAQSTPGKIEIMQDDGGNAGSGSLIVWYAYGGGEGGYGAWLASLRDAYSNVADVAPVAPGSAGGAGAYVIIN